MSDFAGFIGIGTRPLDSEVTLRSLLELLSCAPESPPFLHVEGDSAVGYRLGNVPICQIEQEGLRVWAIGTANQEAPDLPLRILLIAKQENWSVLANLRGTFMAVVEDAPRRKWHLISDSFGLRFLYYARHGKGLVFASEVKAFLGMKGFAAKVHSDALPHFLQHGFHNDDATWLEGVRLLEAATVLTFDLVIGSLNTQKYWEWDEVPQSSESFEECSRELGRIFRQAVSHSCSFGKRPGLTLSGGLDSRALLAAMPEGDIATVTFGKHECADIRLARAAARLKGASHHVMEIGPQNWLTPRMEAVWRSDGHITLRDLHGVESLPLVANEMDVCLNGFLGDAILGGTYLNSRSGSQEELFKQRGRRFILQAVRLTERHCQVELPFFDYDLIRFTLSLPVEWRAESCIYRDMLLREFPLFFRTLPWQKTGLPISTPRAVEKAHSFMRRGWGKALRGTRRIFPSVDGNPDFTDYALWLRSEPTIILLPKLLLDKSSLLGDLMDMHPVRQEWERHLAGEDFAGRLCALMTAELWLQQAFTGKFRSGFSS